MGDCWEGSGRRGSWRGRRVFKEGNGGVEGGRRRGSYCIKDYGILNRFGIKESLQSLYRKHICVG